MSQARGTLALVKTDAGRDGAPPPMPPTTDCPPSPAEAPSPTRDSYASTAVADVIDRSTHAATARFTAGLSPIALADAYLDWASHVAFSPGS
jgi:polyhydroxyalkanoate synthase